MNSSELKNKTINAAFWNISGTLINQGVSFVISIFLARLLSPSDFGLIGMTMVLITITQSFSDFGMTSGLIQKQNPTENQYSTVFWINLSISFLLMLTMIALSGIIAKFYVIEEISAIAKFTSITFVINALNNVQLAKLTKQLANKVKVMATLTSAIVSGATGIALALGGFGVWSLVYSSLLGSIINTLVLWNKSEWRPKLVYNFSEVKELLNFGSKMFASGLLDTIYSRFDIIIIGKMFTPVLLGYYYRALSFNQIIIKYAAGGMQGIFFPVFSHLQNDKPQQIKIVNQSLNMVSFITFMLCGLMYLCAEEIIIILFTEKWLPSVKYFQIMVFSTYAYPISVILVNVLSGNGRSDKFLKLEIWKKLAGAAAMLTGFIWGIEGFLWSSVFATAFSLFMNIWYVESTINMTIKNQYYIILRYAICASVGAVPILVIQPFMPQIIWVALFIKSILFVAVYFVANRITRSSGLAEFSQIVKNIWQRKWSVA